MTSTLQVTRGDLRRIVELARPRWSRPRWRHDPFVFGSSTSGIWPRTWRDPASRIYVDGESVVLDQVRELALIHHGHPVYGAGGLVRIDDAGACLIATGEQLVSFDLVTEPSG